MSQHGSTRVTIQFLTNFEDVHSTVSPIQVGAWNFDTRVCGTCNYTPIILVLVCDYKYHKHKKHSLYANIIWTDNTLQD